MCVEAVSTDNVKVLNVEMVTDNQLKHEHKEIILITTISYVSPR